MKFLVAVVVLVTAAVVAVIAAVVVVIAVGSSANVDVVLIALKNVCKSQKCQPHRLQRSLRLCRPNQLSCVSLSLNLYLCLSHSLCLLVR